ncbi:hypothetical protein Emag_003254 [Eimeria magna]
MVGERNEIPAKASPHQHAERHANLLTDIKPAPATVGKSSSSSNTSRTSQQQHEHGQPSTAAAASYPFFKVETPLSLLQHHVRATAAHEFSSITRAAQSSKKTEAAARDAAAALADGRDCGSRTISSDSTKPNAKQQQEGQPDGALREFDEEAEEHLGPHNAIDAKAKSEGVARNQEGADPRRQSLRGYAGERQKRTGS